MRIGIDVSILGQKYDGIGFYLRRVLMFLANHPENTYFLYSNNRIENGFESFDNFVLVENDGSKSHLKWILTDLKEYIKRDKIEIFWQPEYILPFKIDGCKNVVTIHDLSGYRNLKYVDVKTFVKQRLFLKKTCKLADLILTISNFSKQEICSLLKIKEERIKVVYASLANSFSDSDSLFTSPSSKLKLNIKENDYYLFVGTLAPRKNDKIIIKSICEYFNKGGTKKFVFAGKVSMKSKRLVSRIPKKYSNNMFFTGYVDNSTKEALYRNAFCVLYPSRLEGFGIPILEAMAFKKPLITTNVSCIPEVAGDAALFLSNVDDYCELSMLYFKLERMPKTEIDLMIKKGLDRVKYFEYLNYPKAIYDELIGLY